ncbi:major capsid protein [Microviridae sp.]|nr:major capsid protein [Microviridae sp.]
MSIFNKVKLPGVNSNRFNLSHDVKLSLRMGTITPTCCMEVVPGDKISISTQNMLRFLPLISPVMHKVNVTTHFFFVPNRILWPEWEKWITGDTDAAVPVASIGETEKGSLADYMGSPVGSYQVDIDFSVLPFAAYRKIWDEYYRDQNLQDEIFVPLVPGDNVAYEEDFQAGSLQKRAWRHDYFTSALPFAQKGDAVTLPLIQGGPVPVTDSGVNNNDILRSAVDGSIITAPSNLETITGGGLTADGTTSAYLDPNGNLEVDINNEAADINTLRRAFRLQEWLERNARGGTRYIENILAHFGVRSSDARLQRPEYLGGAQQNMVISEVLSTANTETETEGSPVGQMSGHGISVGGGKGFNYRAEEHGFIIGLINVQPTTAYQQGIHKMFSRADRLDYYWPSFANIGEQEILNKELYAFAPPSGLNETFGYIPRYSEYKFQNSRVAGELRDTLSYWHLGRIFDSTPSLNESFIEADPSTRIFAVTDPDEDHIVAHVYHKISAIRKMPKYGIPTI